MTAAYHQLLHLHNNHRFATVTISAFGQHFDIYRDQVKLGMVPYSEEDKRNIINHQWEDVHPLTRHIPIERFLSVLAPVAS